MNYDEFIEQKSDLASGHGSEPTWMPEQLFDFQRALVDWSLRLGRAAVFADCGLGKTAIQLTWAENVVRHTHGRVLILSPLAVGPQTVAEGEKFGIQCARSRDGSIDGARIIVTNYEKLHLFDPADFAGLVCDESSILKHFTGATQRQVTRFVRGIQYRLLCTATAAPNDYVELGTSSEALGVMGHSDMLTRFFKQSDGKPMRIQDVKNARAAKHFGKLSFRVSQDLAKWRLKGHAQEPFWRWVSSWARACRRPSDLGFTDEGYALPPLIEREHVVTPSRPADGLLFVMPAFGLQEEREERRRTIVERCERAAALVAHDRPAVVWCHMNAEGDMLERLIPGAVQVAGKDDDDAKEEAYRAFAAGDVRVLVTKPKIGAWGLNWQHCSDVVTFATHSYEQHYQAIRRCWRFGQTRPVTVDVISTEGEVRVRDSLKRKSEAADAMFAQLCEHMRAATTIEKRKRAAGKLEVPSWL